MDISSLPALSSETTAMGSNETVPGSFTSSMITAAVLGSNGENAAL
jgi:hypothetical protein